MEIDEKAHNEEYENCLEFVRVRVMNIGSTDDLWTALKKKEK